MFAGHFRPGPLLQTLLDDHRSGAHDLGNQLREVQIITWHFATDNHKSGKHREALQLVSWLSACKTGLSQAAMGTVLNLRALSHSHLGEHEHAKQSVTEAADLSNSATTLFTHFLVELNDPESDDTKVEGYIHELVSAADFNDGMLNDCVLECSRVQRTKPVLCAINEIIKRM